MYKLNIIRKLNKSKLYELFHNRHFDKVPKLWKPLYDDLQNSKNIIFLNTFKNYASCFTCATVIAISYINNISLVVHAEQSEFSVYLLHFLLNYLFYPSLAVTVILAVIYNIQGFSFSDNYTKHSINQKSYIPLEILTDILRNSKLLKNQSESAMPKIMRFLSEYDNIWQLIYGDYLKGRSPSHSFDLRFSNVFLYDYSQLIQNEKHLRSQTISALRTLFSISNFENELLQENKYLLENKIKEMTDDELENLKVCLDDNINRVLNQEQPTFSIQDIKRYLQ